jgi:manganese transport protein
VREDPRSEAEQREPPETFWGRLRHLGPGLIITGSIVGSGELIMTTKLGSEAGFTLLWLVVLGCLVKVFVQVEIGRYAISSAETTLKALDRIPGPRLVVSWILWLWLVMYIATILQLSGIVGGVTGIFALWLPGTSGALWTATIVLSVILLLVWGRYRMVERVSTGLVCLFTVLTVAAVGLLEWTEHPIRASDILDGLRFSLTRRDGELVDFTTAFAAFGITGVGASELIFYPYWCLEKGYARFAGPRLDREEWAARARGWIRVLQLDAWISLVVYTVATAAFYLLGAAVLHGRSIKVENENLIENLSAMYRTSFGPWGLAIFLVGAFFVLYSTLFVATASNARLFADSLGIFKVFRYRRPGQVSAMVRLACVLIPLCAGSLCLSIGQPLTLVVVGGLAQACMLPLLGGAALYLRFFRADPRLAPGRLWTAFLGLSFLAMTAIGAYQLQDIGRSLWRRPAPEQVPPPSAASQE